MNYRFGSDNLVYYSVLFNFGHIRRWDQCAVYILYSKISTDPGLPKIRHSYRIVAVVIQILIPSVNANPGLNVIQIGVTQFSKCHPFFQVSPVFPSRTIFLRVTYFCKCDPFLQM